MTDIILSPITSGYNVSKINSNFTVIANAINNSILHLVGGNNTMQQPLDMNGFPILNMQTDPNDPDSMLTVAEGDARYYNVSGDSLTGPMNVNDQIVSGLKLAVGPTDAVRKSQLDDEIDARTEADMSLQDQINGTTPPLASAFSIISWHDQVIENSISIPDGKNAWSFGPSLTVAEGQTVEIGDGSFWTVANGAVAGTGVLLPEIPDPLDMGVLS